MNKIMQRLERLEKEKIKRIDDIFVCEIDDSESSCINVGTADNFINKNFYTADECKGYLNSLQEIYPNIKIHIIGLALSEFATIQ